MWAQWGSSRDMDPLRQPLVSKHRTEHAHLVTDHPTAAMGGVYEFVRRAAANLREKEDSWNPTIGGFFAGATTGLRGERARSCLDQENSTTDFVSSTDVTCRSWIRRRGCDSVGCIRLYWWLLIRLFIIRSRNGRIRKEAAFEEEQKETDRGDDSGVG